MTPDQPPTPFPGAYPPPPAKSNSVRTLLIVLGSIGAVFLCCCGGGGVITYFGIRAATADEGRKIAELVGNKPLVQEKLGGIDEIRFNMGATLNADGDARVFDVRGPKGSGQLVVEEFFYEYVSILLKTSDGEWELLEDEEAASSPDELE